MADPLAGGSSFSSCEPKIEYDEELDFLSPQFNPERALHSPHTVIPYPDIKSFESLQKYHDAVKSRSKPKPAAATESKGKIKKNVVVETHLGNPHQSQSTAHKQAQQLKHDEASSGESSTSCNKPSTSSASITSTSISKEQRAEERPGKLPRTSSAHRVEEEQALDLSLKTSSAFTQAVPSSSGRESDTSLRSNGKSSDNNASASIKDKKPLSVRSHSSHEKSLNISSKSTESSRTSNRSHEKSSRKSHSLARSDDSSHKHVKSLTGKISTTNYEESSELFVRSPESNPNYLTKSEKHLRAPGSTDEKKSHSTSSHNTEKQHYESSRSRRSSKDIRVLSKSNEHSPDTSARSQERTSHASRNSQRPSGTLPKSEFIIIASVSRKTERPLYSSGGKDERRSTSYSTTSERQELVSDNRMDKRHPETKQSYQTQKPRSDTVGLLKTPADYKKGNPQQVEILPLEIPGSSTLRKNNKSRFRNVFSRMECMIGPLHVLTRCVQEHLQVRVMTRGATCVKSICRGYIVAFDKHCNMALIDVDEIFRRPAALGKIKSRRSHKLLAAQTTLQKEKEEYMAKWNDEQSIRHASSSLQDLSLQTDESLKNPEFSMDVSEYQEEVLTAGTNPSFNQSTQAGTSHSSKVRPCHASTPRREATSSHHSGAVEEEAQIPLNKLSQSAQAKLRRIQSVYEGQKVPLSPFEREALMLGIADENLNHRHVNQLFVRGENVVSVSIIEDI